MSEIKLKESFKTKIKILFTESFFPYLFLIITLIIALLVIDRKIENQDDVIVVNLNREEILVDEQPTILQRINLDNISEISDEKKKQVIIQINELIDQHQWKASIKIIDNLTDAVLKNHVETRITLAYLYYKNGESQKGIEVLKQTNPSNNARYYYNMGLLHSRHPKTYSDAVKYFEKYLDYKKSSYEAFMNIGHLYYRLTKYDDALKYYKKSEELSNLERKARACYWTALTQIKMKHPEKALEYLDLAIHNDPEFVQARVRRAELTIKSDPENTLEALKRVIQAYPDYMETYHLLEDYYVNNGEPEKALYWIKRGLENAPNSTQMKSGIGSLYLKLKEYEKAKQIFQELVDQFPNEEYYIFNLARSYFGLGDYEQSAKAYQTALKIRPVYYETFINLGIVFAKLNNPEKALYYYNKAIEVNSTDGSVYYNMGILYSKLEQKQAALDAYQKALSIKINYPEVYFNMGIVYNRLADFENSIKSYRNAIKYNKDYINAYYNLASLYEQSGDKKKTIETLEWGIKITNDLKLKNKLALVYEFEKDTSRAQKLYMEILEIDPENTDALINLSKLLLNLKNYQESKKYIDKYLTGNPKNTEARYVLMVDAYNLGKFDQAYNQWEILERISPNYKDIADYKDKIISRMD